MVEANTVFQLLGPLEESAKELRVPGGHQIFYKTDVARKVYCVVEGLVWQYRPGDDSNIHKIIDLEPCSLFGVESAILGRDYHLSAVAVEDSTLLEVDAVDLNAQIRKNPEFRLQMARRLALRVRYSIAHTEAVLFEGERRITHLRNPRTHINFGLIP